VMKDPDTTKKFADQGAEVVTSSPEEFGKFVESEIARWRKLIESAKITAD
jgi:tripartite-type tricarboxylate transporter receptor subunit TctC